MGNNASIYEDASEVDLEPFAFFKSLSAADVAGFFSQVVARCEGAHVSWRDYFRYFQALDERRASEELRRQRASYHCACSGFAMVREQGELRYEEVPQPPQPEPPPLVPDNYTEPSDYGDDYGDGDENIGNSANGMQGVHQEGKDGSRDQRQGEEMEHATEGMDEERGSKSARQPRRVRVVGWDAKVVSPIYFGYTHTKQAEFDREQKAQKVESESAELQAIHTALASRDEKLKQLVAQHRQRSAAREEKLKKLADSYEIARKRAKEAFEQSLRMLSGGQVEMLKRKFAQDEKAAQKAHAIETREMKLSAKQRTAAEQAEIAACTLDFEAYQSAEKQETPDASHLEDLVKQDIEVWSREVRELSSNLEAVKSEYENIKVELRDRSGEQKQDHSNRSMFIAIEGRVTEAANKLEVAVQSLEQNMRLLGRAAELKRLEQALLPLFQSIAGIDRPRAAPKMLVFVAVAALTNLQFDDKATVLLECTGSAPSTPIYFPELIELLRYGCQAFHRLGFLSSMPSDNNLEGLLSRAMLEQGRRSTGEALTRYEARNMIRELVARSFELSRVLNAGPLAGGGMSSFMRTMMHPWQQLVKGLIGPADFQFIMHRVAITPPSCLNPETKRRLHDRALSCGRNDPMKPTYSKFMNDVRRRGVGSQLTKSETGRWISLRYFQSKLESRAAVKIQSLIRGEAGRRLAEAQARELAFADAKNLALAEMRERIELDFKAREGQTGVTKMKWDAQVRARQTKLKAAGQPSTRADVLQIMMQETMEEAKIQIINRFAELARERKIHMHAKPTSGNAPGERLITPISRLAVPEAAEPFLRQVSRAFTESRHGADAAYQPLLDRMVQVVRGDLIAQHVGEYLDTYELGFLLSLPEPGKGALYDRLRCLHRLISHLKAEALIAYFPSKRMLLEWVARNTLSSIEEQLQQRFKLTDGFTDVARRLKTMLASDLEAGIIVSTVHTWMATADTILRSLEHTKVTRNLEQMRRSMLLRKATLTDGTWTDQQVLELELERERAFVAKVEQNAMQQVEAIQKLASALRRAMISVEESWSRQNALRFLHDTDPSKLLINPRTRFDWSARYNRACAAQTSGNDADTTAPQEDAGFVELLNVGSEFLRYAVQDAITIIHEMFEPNYRRTIPAISGAVNNGLGEQHHQEGGSSKQPQSEQQQHNASLFSTVYEAHDIQYRICVANGHSIFNGSDELAAKAAAHELHGSTAYHSCQGVRVPIMATIDYFGFRVLACSKAHIEIPQFTDTGELRAMHVQQVLGFPEQSSKYSSSSPQLEKLLDAASQQMNLAPHAIKGAHDTQEHRISWSSDLKAHMGRDNCIYLSSFWRTFPPEDSRSTTHLLPVPRDMSLFWRRFRPEFVQRYNEQLSSDADGGVTYRTQDGEEHAARIQRATLHLVHDVIPRFAHELASREYSTSAADGLGIDLTGELHGRGINVRHLGLLRSLLTRRLPWTVTQTTGDNFLIPAGNSHYEVFNKQRIRVADQEYVVTVSAKNQLLPLNIPINKPVPGVSRSNLDAYVGCIGDVSVTTDVRAVLFAEMLARTGKSIVREYLRTAAKSSKYCPEQLPLNFVCNIFNVITGHHEQAMDLLRTQFYLKMCDKFGVMSISPYERDHMLQLLQPAVKYCILRLQQMLNVQIAGAAMSNFVHRPFGFKFRMTDFVGVTPSISHNMSWLHYSQAVLLAKQAAQVAQHDYHAGVVKDGAVLYWTLRERIGSTEVHNAGSLGTEYVGACSLGCKFELPGPITTDEASRAMGFQADLEANIDAGPSKLLVPDDDRQPFTAEVWVMVTGGQHSNRFAVSSGRYGVVASREEQWCTYFSVASVELTYPVAPLEYNVWIHYVIAWDGTVLRTYMNGVLMSAVEPNDQARRRILESTKKYEEARSQLEAEEQQERKQLNLRTEEEAADYFRTKAGYARLREVSIRLLEANASQQLPEAREDGSAKFGKEDALNLARQQYVSELFTKNANTIAERYKQLRDDIRDQERKEKEVADVICSRPLCVGATSGRTPRELSQYFQGRVACLALYHSALSADVVRGHYTAATSHSDEEGDRLFGAALRQFHGAIHQHQDPTMLKHYASCLCGYLRTQQRRLDTSRYVTKLLDAVRTLQLVNCAEGLAEIISLLPDDTAFGVPLVKAFQALMIVSPSFFDSSTALRRKDIALLPFKFALCAEPAHHEMYSTAAAMFKQALLDPDLSEFYGGRRLHWIPKLQASAVVVNLVQQAHDDEDERVLRLADVGSMLLREVSDDQIDIVLTHARELVAMELAGCSELTDAALALCGKRARMLKVLVLNGCSKITDKGIESLSSLGATLETFACARVPKLSDDGVMKLVRACPRLQVVDLTGCYEVGDASVVALAQSCKHLQALHVSQCAITDDGMNRFAAAVNGNQFRSLDISFCRAVTDFGILSLTEACPNLSFLNISSANRITTDGVMTITHRCWKLHTLLMEDIFLTTDQAFWFSLKCDGRQAARDSMLTQLRTISLADCMNVTDHAIEGITSRTKHLEVVNLRGCHRLTDAALQLLLNVPVSHIRVANFAFCSALTQNGLVTFVQSCPQLEEVNFSGIPAVCDSLVHYIAKYRPTLTRVALAKCHSVTDRALCSLVEYLWLHSLDVHSCTKVTDEGVRVLVSVCSGIEHLNLSKCHKITDSAIRSILRHAKSLKTLNVDGCPSVSQACLEWLQARKPSLSVTTVA